MSRFVSKPVGGLQSALFEPELAPERFPREIRWLWAILPYRPERERMFADGLSPVWQEWCGIRGIDPDRPRTSAPARPQLPPRLRLAVIERDGYVCQLCGAEVEPTDVHIDHVFPFSLGGGHTLDNLQVAHSRCNIRKGAQVLGMAR